MATLAACVIVGKNESFELGRLLKSIQGTLFDQICVTTTQGDHEVESVARRLATTVSSFQWIDDFSAARNYNFSTATTSHIMWLDSDDVITPENYRKLQAIKSGLDQVDMVVLSYNYGHDDKGNPTVVLPRERIVRNDQSLVKWHDPIHEYLNMDGGVRIASNKEIAVDHYRIKPFNASRNLAIHQKVWDAGNMSPRQMFYYAKDLIDSGNGKGAAPVFERYLDGPTDFADNKAIACLRLAGYYRDELQDHESSYQYLLRGLQYSNQYAEFPFLIGMYFKDIRRDADKAIAYLREAAGKPMQAGMSMQAEFYEYLPCKQLSFLYYDKGDYAQAYHFCERAAKACPTDPHCPHNLEVIRKAMQSFDKPEEAVGASQGAAVKMAWLIPAFYPEDPAQRIRRLNVHEAMAKEDAETSKLLVGYHGVPAEKTLEMLGGIDTVVMSSLADQDLALMKALKASGKKVVLDLCESLFDVPTVASMTAEADLVVCCSTKLAEMASAHSANVVVIPDATEACLPQGTDHQYLRPERDQPVALYMGMGGNSFLVTDHLRSAIEGAGYRLQVCSEWDNADVRWTLEGWEDVMRSADVVLCPQRVDVQPAKSNVKVTQAMALGLPVVASRLQSYEEVIVSGHNGYLCTGVSEWEAALTALRSDNKRIQVGMNAAQSVEGYRVEAVAKKWEAVVSSLLSGSHTAQGGPAQDLKGPPPPRETVPVIIPVYNGLPYLKQCLSSIHMNTTHPYHVILSDAGSDAETWEYLKTLKGITVLGEPGQRRNFSEACNAGIRASSGKYFVILNSDVIVSRGWLEPLVEQMSSGDRLAACGVLSNCDRGWLHGVPGRNEVFPMRLIGAGLELVPGMKLEQVTPHLDELGQFMAWSNEHNKGKYVRQPWVAAYATIFARSAIDEVGLFDTSFRNGCEDLDLCRRLVNKSYTIGQRMDSFIFHYGGISRGAYQDEDRESYDKEDRFNHDLYSSKWEKQRIVIYTGPAWERWDREAVDKGMAGSETWAAELAAEFSRRGFYVTLFNDCPEDGAVDRDGVVYRHHSKYQEYLEYNYIDHTILSRTCEPMKNMALHSGTVDVMVHDIWLSQDPGYDTMHWAIGKFGVLSDWHREFFHTHHKIPKEKLFLTSNGVDTNLYADSDGFVKANRAVYSSSPDRGLRQLLEMVPAIRESVPDFELVVAYGFHNWESAAKMRGNSAELQVISEMKAMLDQPGVRYVGRVSKKELAELQKSAKVWAYPTGFTETFCIGAVENGMARNAVVTTPLAGILTTLKDSPCYIEGPSDVHPTLWNTTETYRKSFVAEVVHLLQDDGHRQEVSDRVHEAVAGYTWQRAADSWQSLWATGC